MSSITKKIHKKNKIMHTGILKDNEIYPMGGNMAMISSGMYAKLTSKNVSSKGDMIVPMSFLQQFLVQIGNTNTHKRTNDEDIEKLGPAEMAIAYADNGILAKRAGEYEKAIEYYKNSLAADPKCGMTYYNLGKVLYLTHKYDEAKRAYYLSYIYNSKNDEKNIYRHIGHTVIDTAKKYKIHYADEIARYIDGISGKPVQQMESPQYLALCIKAGKAEIEKLNKESAEKTANEV